MIITGFDHSSKFDSNVIKFDAFYISSILLTLTKLLSFFKTKEIAIVILIAYFILGYEIIIISLREYVT